MSNFISAILPKNTPIGPDPLSDEKLALILKNEFPDWKIVNSPLPTDTFILKKEIYREYVFNDFDSVILFMSKVAVGCNIFPHHPRWENTWTTLKVWLSTWDIEHIITYKDIMLARYMDKIYTDFDKPNENLHTSARKKTEHSNFLKKLQSLIGENKLVEAIEKVFEYNSLNPEDDKTEEVILLKSRLTRVQNDYLNNTIKREDFELEITKLSQSLLKIIKNLSNGEIK
ncbi:MAG: 4a-hydroxytetrahydrobiopterin dehydratase [Saprospiraceae bacterium]|nr:4a-hydroxytetrahydrobiopterin dehydratase [Saprospiraceae bacterium]